jgi:Extracellular link domain
MASGSLFTNVTNAMGLKNSSALNNVTSIFPLSSAPSPAAVSKAAANVANAPKSNMVYTLLIFVGTIVMFLMIFVSFNTEIRQGFEYSLNSFLLFFKGFFGYPDGSVVAEVIPTSGDITELTTPPTDVKKDTEKIVELNLPLPLGDKEVFNVSTNKYTYYDAEPLCKALGAELATYDQVKAAWDRGADWCNYGWVKGQMAVYPTQKGTYDSLNDGPADQRGSCGTVGLNGGYFDNPELTYGVNCYGNKPQQTLPGSSGLPVTPGLIAFNKKVGEFAHEAETTPVAPFNHSKWSGDLV